MLRTRLSELLGVEVAIIQASLGPWSTPELTAAVSEAGAVGTLGGVLRAPDELRAQIRRVRELTDRPFVVNLSKRPFDADLFAVALDERVPALSFAHGDPEDLPVRAHDAGALFVQMVNTVAQARVAVDRGVDALIAQGAEAGGFVGEVATMCLVPQVVDVAGELPVVAAGGIADGRGIAAALLLGADGVNIGTRFVAATEAGVSASWQQQIIEARSEDTVKLAFADALIPRPPGTYPASPRVLPTTFVDEWNARPEVADVSSQLGAKLVEMARSGRLDELLRFTGQSAGLIRDVIPAAEIVRRLAAEAVEALEGAPALVSR